MRPIFYFVLAAAASGQASPMPQAAAAIDGAVLPALPSSSVRPSPLPLGNAAIWQEAYQLDTTVAVGKNFINEHFYQLIAYLQSMENSSNSYTLGLESLTASSTTSQGLQYLNIYPTLFDQSQASNPATTQSESSCN